MQGRALARFRPRMLGRQVKYINGSTGFTGASECAPLQANRQPMPCRRSGYDTTVQRAASPCKSSNTHGSRWPRPSASAPAGRGINIPFCLERSLENLFEGFACKHCYGLHLPVRDDRPCETAVVHEAIQERFYGVASFRRQCASEYTFRIPVSIIKQADQLPQRVLPVGEVLEVFRKVPLSRTPRVECRLASESSPAAPCLPYGDPAVVLGRQQASPRRERLQLFHVLANSRARRAVRLQLISAQWTVPFYRSRGHGARGRDPRARCSIPLRAWGRDQHRLSRDWNNRCRSSKQSRDSLPSRHVPAATRGMPSVALRIRAKTLDRPQLPGRYGVRTSRGEFLPELRALGLILGDKGQGVLPHVGRRPNLGHRAHQSVPSDRETLPRR